MGMHRYDSKKKIMTSKTWEVPELFPALVLLEITLPDIMILYTPNARVCMFGGWRKMRFGRRT
jgi:hypothetical protein